MIGGTGVEEIIRLGLQQSDQGRETMRRMEME